MKAFSALLFIDKVTFKNVSSKNPATKLIVRPANELAFYTDSYELLFIWLNGPNPASVLADKG